MLLIRKLVEWRLIYISGNNCTVYQWFRSHFIFTVWPISSKIIYSLYPVIIFSWGLLVKYDSIGNEKLLLSLHLMTDVKL